MSVEFIYFKKNEYNLFLAEAEENSALYRSYLRQKGVEQNQYFNVDLPNVFDIADDILSEYADIICFIVEKENVDFTSTVAKAVYNCEEDVKIIFACLEAGVEVNLPHVECVKASSVVTVLNELLELEDNDKEFPDINEVKPYEENLFPIKSCRDYGILLNKKIFFFDCVYVANEKTCINELLYVSKHVPRGSTILLNSDDITEYQYLDKFLTNLKTVELPLKIVLIQALDTIDKKSQKKLEDANITIIEPKINDKNYQAFINGLQAFHIGFYNDNSMGDYTKHIEVDKREINEELLRKLAGHNAGNSAIYGIGNDSNVSYDEVKKMASKVGFLLTNYLDFQEAEDGITVNVHINGDENAYTYQVQPYSNYSSGEDRMSLVSIETKEDFQCFYDDYQQFKKTGKIHEERMWKPLLKDRCRFGINGFCSLSKLQKMKVKDGYVYPCSGCSKSISALESEHFQMLKNVCVEREKEQVIRKCNECSARTICSQCTMLPDYLPTERYCELVKADEGITRYLCVMFDVNYIFKLAKIDMLKEVDVSEVLFLTKDNKIELEEEVKGENDYFDMNLILYKYPKNNAYIAFNLTNKKAFSMNQNMFILCELLYKGLSIEDIQRYLCKKYSLKVEETKEIIKNGLSILNEKGYLKRDVYRNGVL